MNTFRARYDGRCPSCAVVIESGDLLTYDDGQVVHAECADVERPERRVRATCPDCWQEYAVNGDCACTP